MSHTLISRRTATPTQPFVSETDSDETAVTTDIKWPAKWLKQKLRDLQALCRLPPNWDSYDAAPVNRDAISHAIQRLEMIARITTEEPSVLASPSGTPLLSWTNKGGNTVFELEFLSDGTVNYALTDFSNSSHDQEGTASCLRDFIDLIPGA